MLLTPTPDQDLYRDTTARFLDEHAPPAELRRLRDDPAGFVAEYWRRGAELGWTSLLVPETSGGGSISGDGLVDLTLVAHEFGRHAAPGPLVSSNVVAAALGAHGGTHDDALAGLLSGAIVATWCHAEPPPDDALGTVTLEVRVDGDEVVLDGVKRPVESAGQADLLLVTGRTGDGLTQVLVPRDQSGVTISALQTVDVTRRLCTVAFDEVRLPATAVVGGIGEAAEQIAHQGEIACTIADAESIGAMQAGFDMTVAWAFDRYSFGRPLASYQALKHRFADMAAWLEAAHALAEETAEAVAARSPEAGEMVSASHAFVGHYGSELLHDCIQIFGGIGVTFDHDLHLLLRRHTVNRALFGTPAEHRRLLAEHMERNEDGDSEGTEAA